MAEPQIDAVNQTNRSPVTSNIEDKTGGISSDEIALYDRQIRLWGLQAQEKIRTAALLVIGVGALGSEINKNLVLAGIGSLTILDTRLVEESDVCSNYLFSESDVGKKRAHVATEALKRMNPRVPIYCPDVDFAQDLTSFWSNFSLIIATDQPWDRITLFNAAARLSGVPFYAVGSHGLYGFVFADLGIHEFLVTRNRSNVQAQPGTLETPTRAILSVVEQPDPQEPNNTSKRIELITKRETYQPLILANSSPLPTGQINSRRRLKAVPQLLPCLRALFEFEAKHQRRPTTAPEDLTEFTVLATTKSRELLLPFDLLEASFVRAFMQNWYGELAPTCAVLGGVVAQEAINVLGGREQPIQNMLLFDGDTCQSPVYAFMPFVPEATALPV